MSTLRDKWVWVATETKKGWRLKLTVGKKVKFNLVGLLLKKRKDVERIVNGPRLYVFLGDTEYFPKGA